MPGGDVKLHKLVAALLRADVTVEVPGLLGGHAVGHEGLAVGIPRGTATKVAAFGDAFEAGAVGVNDVDVDNVQYLPSAFRVG